MQQEDTTNIKKAKHYRVLKRIALILIMVFLMSPLFFHLMYREYQDEQIKNFEVDVNAMPDYETEERMRLARAYNANLPEQNDRGFSLVGNLFGILEIPALDLVLPIYLDEQTAEFTYEPPSLIDTEDWISQRPTRTNPTIEASEGEQIDTTFKITQSVEIPTTSQATTSQTETTASSEQTETIAPSEQTETEPTSTASETTQTQATESSTIAETETTIEATTEKLTETEITQSAEAKVTSDIWQAIDDFFSGDRLATKFSTWYENQAHQLFSDKGVYHHKGSFVPDGGENQPLVLFGNQGNIVMPELFRLEKLPKNSNILLHTFNSTINYQVKAINKNKVDQTELVITDSPHDLQIIAQSKTTNTIVEAARVETREANMNEILSNPTVFILLLPVILVLIGIFIYQRITNKKLENRIKEIERKVQEQAKEDNRSQANSEKN
ncbi:MAG: hypothetical protein GX326_01625 [Clostridiaceae bacterium]|nr:hypothetical protein [Clostridiaceae bacterium]